MTNSKLADRATDVVDETQCQMCQVDFQTRSEVCSTGVCARGYEIQMEYDKPGRFGD